MEAINQNFEGLKNGLTTERERERERERVERDCFYLPETNQAPDLSLEAASFAEVATKAESAKWDLSGFSRLWRDPVAAGQFNIQRGKSDVIFAADFLFFEKFKNACNSQIRA